MRQVIIAATVETRRQAARSAVSVFCLSDRLHTAGLACVGSAEVSQQQSQPSLECGWGGRRDVREGSRGLLPLRLFCLFSLFLLLSLTSMSGDPFCLSSILPLRVALPLFLVFLSPALFVGGPLP
ncbi:hypothetical protein BLNAU_18671 [Blattamonas nauphoetae]|uniref:Transmembrane protein n=1 Tax=Blattamonas nauphoetae TaxID=2049346 RepID=A0ABQ9X7K7_9EUKA|nr:hypothetical protein BLNAU_18671 [Blattamonas nauphoetae]